MKSMNNQNVRSFKNAIGYVRVSTEENTGDDIYSIETQKKEILAFADERGYHILEWMIDECSGENDSCPEFDKILDGGNIMNPPFEAVIVFNNDRVATDTKLYFYYLYVLEKRNIKLMSTRESFAEGDDFANICRSLLMFVAGKEKKNFALRTSKGRLVKAQYGGYSGGRCPYGYKVVDGVLTINEEEKPIVEFVFSEHDRGTNMLATADKLRELGYRTRKGTTFQASSVKSILNNRPLYEGMYKYGKTGTWVQGVHEPILKKED